jgi:N-acetylmuramic acid 6-phosphate etherase
MQLEDFLSSSRYFSLGHLPTEGFHPATGDLSRLSRSDPGSAIRLIREIDLHAFQTVKDALPLIRTLSSEIHQAIDSGARVFISGCGATGRLALALESVWRALHAGTPKQHQVQGLMAGGDFALVKSVENFEDFPEYGERHLAELGFREGDLLIAVTEGGETPYVIGTVHGALQHSSRHPWFLFCNPAGLLAGTVERSREVIENPRVNNLCLPVGPMALSGSTRLQAATAQMAALGMALTRNFFLADLFLDEYAALALEDFLVPVIEWESNAYRQGCALLYQTSTYPIAVLTDTTERSPTFSLTPFEKSTQTDGPCSLCYLSIPDAHTPLESWRRILGRDPIGLEWPELTSPLGRESILEFDFGREAMIRRAERVHPKRQKILRLDGHHRTGEIEFKSDDFDLRLKSSLVQDPLAEQLFVKLLLNTHSLLVMGRLDRYEGNVMTWVRASNGKLIDRSLRYLERLIEQRGISAGGRAPSREVLARMIFETQPTLQPDEPLILALLKKLESAPKT